MTDRCFGKPSRRMIAESVKIDQLKDSETMNSRHEWTFVRLSKIQSGMQICLS